MVINLAKHTQAHHNEHIHNPLYITQNYAKQTQNVFGNTKIESFEIHLL